MWKSQVQVIRGITSPLAHRLSTEKEGFVPFRLILSTGLSTGYPQFHETKYGTCTFLEALIPVPCLGLLDIGTSLKRSIGIGSYLK